MQVTPEDIVSLQPDNEVLTTVIDCWSLLLNDSHKKESGGVMQRFCFGLNTYVSFLLYVFLYIYVCVLYPNG